MNEFENTWAIILGGSSGLGLATAHKLASHGMNICIVHRDKRQNLTTFETEVKKLESTGVAVKTYNQDALKESVKNEILSNFPKQSVKLILHSIAKGSLKTMAGPSNEILSQQDFEITLNAMALSWYGWTQTLLQRELFAENARSIAFTSEGNTKVWPGYAAVSTAKAALEALMRSMAVELAPLGLTTNCIQAGTTITPSFLAIPGSAQLSEISKNRNPFGRLTTPADVANAVYLLCKKEGKWINGTILKVDGGESLR